VKRVLIVLLTGAFALSGCVNPNKLPGIRAIAEQQDERRRKATDEAVRNSVTLQELDAFCTRQVPPALEFTRTSRQLDSPEKVSLVYGFSSKADFETARQEYKSLLLPQGFAVTLEDNFSLGNSRILFSNETYSLRIYYFGRSEKENYKIHCERIAPVNKSEPSPNSQDSR
jgi:hypothetical protein